MSFVYRLISKHLACLNAKWRLSLILQPDSQTSAKNFLAEALYLSVVKKLEGCSDWPNTSMKHT